MPEETKEHNVLEQPKINAAVIGSGNIGTDLVHKLRRSDWLRLVWVVGVDSSSAGLQRADQLGIKTTHAGIEGLLPHLDADAVRIAFDATSADAHRAHAARLMESGVLVIDLTPAALGPFCVPPVNLFEHAKKQVMNVNMVTCGGQATIPIVHAVSRVQPVEYAEIVATVSSQSIGPGTRKNIDEFTRTTARAIESVAGVPRAKAIILVNPADPPIMMRNTVHCLTSQSPNPAKIRSSLEQIVSEVQVYVPGFRIRNGPVFDGRRISIFLEVEGLGDYLPKYAGNLDIMTSAAVRAGEMFAQEMLCGEASLQSLVQTGNSIQ